MNRSNVIRGIFLGLLAAFFIWRSLTLGGWSYIGLALLYGLVTILVVTNQLASNHQGTALNIGVSLFFLDLVFAKLELAEVADALTSINLLWLIPSVIALLIHLVFRIWRWQYLLKPMGNITFWPTFRAFMIGVGGNMVLPARAGEFLRAYVIGRSSNISKVGSFATVVVERIFDGLTMLFILLLIVIFGANNQILKQIGIAAGIFYVVAFVGVIVFMLRQSWFEDMLRQLMTILNVPENVTEKILDLMSSFGSGLESLRDGKQLAMVIILSFLTWGLIPLSFWPVIAAFDFGVPVPFLIPLLAMPVIALGLTIPGAPAGIGIFQWAGVVALNIGYEMLGTPLVTEAQQATVAASMILLHISQVTPEVLLGIVSFFAEGLTMSDLEAGKEF